MGRTGVEPRARSIRITFTLDGKQHKKTLILNGAPLPPTPANLAYAERLAAEVRQRIRLGTFSMAEYFPDTGDTDAPTTAAKVLADWMAAQRIEDSTRSGYQSAVNMWTAQLGTKPARSIKPGDVQRAIAKRPELSGKTINNYVSVLRDAFALAVADGAVTSNPASNVPRAKHQKPDVDPFTSDEAEKIVSAFDGPMRNMVDFWMWTGMRSGEIFGLQWDNVGHGQVLVCETIVAGQRKASTKTARSRTVLLNSRAKAAIQRQRAHTQLAGGPVFLNPHHGGTWDEQAFAKGQWKGALRKLGVRYRRPYNMRHTYATAMLMAGMTPAFCARQLGHSVEMFLRTYAKWLDGQRDAQEMARLEAAYPQAIPRPPSKSNSSL